jgi:hypothetical protein
MANKRLQFTYLWADEDVLRDDLKEKHAQGMTEWAVQFYARYGFDVDVDPPTGSKPPSKFVLQKAGGVRPDMRSSDEQNRVLEDRRKRNEDEQARVKKARDQAEAANNGPEAKRLKAELDELDGKWHALMNRIIASYTKDEYDLREMLMLKYLSDRIPDSDRFTVVFCRFRYTSQMQMRLPKGGTTGQTFDKLKEPRVRFYGSVVLPLWSGKFAIIDSTYAKGRSVAHEAVHAAGHDHPMGQYLQSVEKRYHGRRLPGQTFEMPRRPQSLSPDIDDPAFDFDEVPHFAWFRGGYDDGPADDLMNYTLEDPKPTEVNLRPAHVELMNKAYFAKTP